VICLILISVSAFGQQTEAERVRQEQEKAILDRRIQAQENSLRRETDRVFHDESLRRGIYKPEQPSKNEIKEANEEYNAARKRLELLRAPNPEDSAKYRDFLSQPKTGLFRLFPDLGCESSLLIKADGDCTDAVSSSWSYSFRQKDYSNDVLFDIRLKDDNFISDGFHSQGILVDLGDIPLQNISTAIEGIKFLIEFKPETRFENARNQFVQIDKGITSNNHFYTKTLKAKENTTYAARLIAYKRQFSLSGFYRNGDSYIENNYFKLNNDKRIDLTVAFRVVRKDENGSITILWKELYRQSSPKLIFEKNLKLVDIKPGQ
jgi:hypothetical protein